MYPVVDDRNQQYRVQAGDRIQIHLRAGAAEGDAITFDKVCLVGGEGASKIGTPFVSGASVTGKVVRQFKDKKVISSRWRHRKNNRRRRGFRAQYTIVQIESING